LGAAVDPIHPQPLLSPQLPEQQHHHRKLPNGRSDDHAYLIRYQNHPCGEDDAGMYDYLTQKATALQQSDHGGIVLRHVHVSHSAIAVHGLVDIDAVVAADPDILYAEPDGWMMLVDEHPATATVVRSSRRVPRQRQRRRQLQQPREQQQQPAPTRSLDWLDGTVDGQYRYAQTGRGVTVYILDSGIDLTHAEFISNNGSRTVTCGLDLRHVIMDNNGNNAPQGGDCRDGWGHGTHVASTIAGRTYGVAKNANIVAVKVLADDGSARFSDVLIGLEYVYNATKIQKDSSSSLPQSPRVVVNLSLGTPRVALLLNAAVRRLMDDLQVPVIAAAGNGKADACTWSPASATTTTTTTGGGTESSSSVLAVGAFQYYPPTTTTGAVSAGTGDSAAAVTYQRVASSNYGPCVSLYAPGHDVTAAWRNHHNSTTITTRTMTGTSAAAPFVTGAVVLYLERQPNMTVAALTAALRNDALSVSMLPPTNNQTTGGPNETVLVVTTRALLAPAVLSSTTPPP
jgi:subtilisin family serine protease